MDNRPRQGSKKGGRRGGYSNGGGTRPSVSVPVQNTSGGCSPMLEGSLDIYLRTRLALILSEAPDRSSWVELQGAVYPARNHLLHQGLRGKPRTTGCSLQQGLRSYPQMEPMWQVLSAAVYLLG
jgi:hypothetical protein